MNPNTAPGYAAANVLLDAVIAITDDEPVAAQPVELALQRLSEIDGAYSVTIDDENEDEVSVTLTLDNLVGGTLVTLGRLVTLLADATATSREEVVSDLRVWLENLSVPEDGPGDGTDGHS